MVAPNPDRRKPLVTVPRTAIVANRDCIRLRREMSACWAAAARIVRCRETSVSANNCRTETRMIRWHVLIMCASESSGRVGPFRRRLKALGFTLLGPSGCGKTKSPRCVAGREASSGLR